MSQVPVSDFCFSNLEFQITEELSFGVKFFYGFLRLNSSLLEVKTTDKIASIQVVGQDPRQSIVFLGKFNSTELNEIVGDLVTKKTAQFFPRIFDDLNLLDSQINRLTVLLLLAIETLNSNT